MRIARLVWILAFATPFLKADELSQADRQALLEKIEKLQESADEKVDERFRVAVAAFRSAMASDDAVLDFYLKCVFKVEFEDQGKKSQEFREWKRAPKQAEQLQDPTFRAALRHQLAWLILTIQQSSAKTKKEDACAHANDAIEALFSNPRVPLVNHHMLNRSVLDTVFAKAYSIDSIKSDSWSMSPVNLETVYDAIILRPLRRADKLEELKAAWHRRILHESQLAGRDLSSPPATKDSFFTDVVPELIWRMEEDLYRSGDQRGAALRMYQHLEKSQSNPKAAEWTQRLRDMLNPPAKKTDAP